MRRARGFTLVELMVVLAIVGMAATAVVLTLPADDQRFVREAETFGARLLRAQEEAILGTRAITVTATAEGYGFTRQRFAEWEPLVERPFGNVLWADGTAPLLPGDQRQVSFQFDPTGVAEPASLTLRHGARQVRVAVDAAGRVVVDAPPG